MSLRLFIDQCVPRSVSESLRDAGHTVELLRDHLPINAKDPDVIAWAQSIDAVLVSLNGDFADIMKLSTRKVRRHHRLASEEPPGITSCNRDAPAHLFR